MARNRAQVIAEVELENKDVGFVQVGQRAAIKLETFPSTRYGIIDATATTLSADAVVDGKRPKNEAGRAPTYFPAHLTLSVGEIDIDRRMIRCRPG